MARKKLTKRQMQKFRTLIGQKVQSYLLNSSFELINLDSREDVDSFTFSMELKRKIPTGMLEPINLNKMLGLKIL
jgi:hypothetical protein